jgi:hypothetical protein
MLLADFAETWEAPNGYAKPATSESASMVGQSTTIIIATVVALRMIGAQTLEVLQLSAGMVQKLLGVQPWLRLYILHLLLGRPRRSGEVPV